MFYVSFDCQACDNVFLYGPVGSLLDEHRGLPVFPGDALEGTYVECDHCGAAHHFGELAVFVEPRRTGAIAEEDL